MARLASLTAGLPQTIPGLTVDRQCGSGLEAIVLACRMIAAGAGSAYLAGGVENISTAPARANRLADGSLKFFDRAQFAPYEMGDPEVGVAAENVATRYGISREQQDSYALESHRRASAAHNDGRFLNELFPVTELAHDDGPRGKLNHAIIDRFPAAFVAGGTVTAGNSCSFSDGAAAVLICSQELAAQHGLSGLRFDDAALGGVDPNYLGMGAAASTTKLLERIPTACDGLIEFNEAFASQVLAVCHELGIDPADINRDGGALALGHPYGASGAQSVVRLFHQANQRPESTTGALAMISIAGGMGISAHFTWQGGN